MLLIGNQIRLSRAMLAAAVDQRYKPLIQNLTHHQVEAGANWLLIDMGPQRKNSADDLAWLVETVQAAVCMPLVLRSDEPAALAAGIQASKDQILIDATLPGITDPAAYLALARKHNTRVALSACPGGLPNPTEERLDLATTTLLPQALDAGLRLEDIYIDPLVTALTCDQAMVPATVETLRLLKIAADPAPNTLIHLDDITDGVADAAKSYVAQAYTAMLLAAGVDALVANALDPDLTYTIRVVRDRDPATAYDRILIRLFDVTKAEVDLDPASVDASDPEQVALLKTVQILTNQVIYANSYLNT